MRVAVPPGAEELADRQSCAPVLHLHGSLCIRTSEFQARREPGQAMAWLTNRDEPLYAFDPSSISAIFAPFQRFAGADDPQDRIIAPVPDKSRGLKQAFIHDIYGKALAMLRVSDIAVAIGYSFNVHDRASYQTLLHAPGESESRTLLVVSPGAGAIASVIRLGFPNLSVEPLESTFKQWVAASFTGIDSKVGGS